MFASSALRHCRQRAGCVQFGMLRQNWSSTMIPKAFVGASQVPPISSCYGFNRSSIDLRSIPINLSGRLFSTRHTRARKFSWANKSPYELLNVPKNATEKEIKLAYFREAKKYHPDLNTTDPEAKEKFQAIAAAYEILSDPAKRRNYDFTGRTYGSATDSQQQAYQQQYQQQHQYTQQQAEEVFRTVQEDMDVLKDALKSVSEELRDEVNIAVDAARRGDWQSVLEVAKAHKALIFGVVVPTVVFLRYPPAVFAG